MKRSCLSRGLNSYEISACLRASLTEYKASFLRLLKFLKSDFLGENKCFESESYETNGISLLTLSSKYGIISVLDSINKKI